MAVDHCPRHLDPGSPVRLRDFVSNTLVQSSMTTGVVLSSLSLVRPLPWPLWAAWATLTTISLGRAVEQERFVERRG